MAAAAAAVLVVQGGWEEALALVEGAVMEQPLVEGFLSIMARFGTKILVSLMVGVVILGTVHFYKQLEANPVFDLGLISNYRKLVPVAIIGSGPAGLGAGVYAARAGLHTVILEGSKPGGLLMGTTDVENWPGEKLILGPDLITKLRSQNQDLGVKFN